jgi:alpha-tubulin suppressor-like RCC1 family protein
MHIDSNCVFHLFLFAISHRLGRPAEADDSEPTPTLVQGFTSKGGLKEDGQVISVAAGDSHTLYLTQNGNVYMTGMYKDADSGQFRDVRSPQESPEGSNLTPVHVSLLPQNVMQIYARGGYNAAMLSDRSIVTWGKRQTSSRRHVFFASTKPRDLLYTCTAVAHPLLLVAVFIVII